MLSRVFGGMHHVYSLKKQGAPHPFWTCIHYGSLATYDSNLLTRLVLGAHGYCLRVDISPGGPNRLKIWLHPRKGREGNMYERHPDIQTAIDQWRGS